MLKFVLNRLGMMLPTVAVVSVVVFLTLHMVPGDPARNLAGPQSTAEDVELIRERLGLNQPLLAQYGIWVWRALQGDLGESFRSRRPVAEEIAQRIPATFQLAGSAMLLALIVGVPMGMIAGLRPNSLLDKFVTSSAVFGVSVPDFVLGLILMIVFSAYLGLLPPTGRGGVEHLILPTITLAASFVANYARLVRANMVGVMSAEYVRTARAKGLRPPRIVLRHALPNASLPLVTLAGIQFGRMLGGAVVVETVFAWPGLGRYMIDGIMARDYFVVQASVMFYGVVIVISNTMSEIIYGVIDPRWVKG